jgi:polar amino acid transport system permease protein
VGAFLSELVAALGRGLLTTLGLSFAALAIGLALGGALGVAGALRVPVLAGLVRGFIHLTRGTPFLVQLYVVYFVLPQTGVAAFSFTALQAAVLALGLYSAAYMAEITRVAMLAVPRGQVEAGLAVGMTLVQRLVHVVFPQALRLAAPPVGGLSVVVIKSTSVVSVVGITELVRTGEVLSLREPQSLLLIYLSIAAAYFVICFPLLRLIRMIEERVGGIRTLA